MRRLCLILLLCLTLGFSCGAVEAEEEQLIDSLPPEAAELMEDIDHHGTGFFPSLLSLGSKALERSTQYISRGLRLCGILLCIVLLCSLCLDPTGNDGIRRSLGAVGIFVAVTGSLSTLVSLAEQTMDKLRAYSGVLLPVMSSAMAVSGGPTTAAALHGGTVLFANLLMSFLSRVLIPCVYFYLTLGAAEAALASKLLGELRELVSWLIEKSMRLILYLFTAYLSLTGLISGRADALAVKAAKAAVSGLVPVVGSLLSDASETMLIGAAVVKNSVGILGLLAILSIVILPFLRVGIQFLLIKLTSACAGSVGMPEHVQYLKQVSTGVGFLLAMTGICASLFLISMVCYLRVVNV